MNLSVVIPMFNEAENAALLLDEIAAALNGTLDYEVVVVNDGSTDTTEQVLLGIQAGMPQLRIITHGVNSGQSASIVTGVRAARAPWIATMDGDSQNDPADIPALFKHTSGISPASSEPLLIAGNRRKRNDNWIRKLSSRVANWTRQALLHDGCPDTGCGLKIFSRDAFMQLPPFDHMHRFLPALFRIAHGQIINVPVNHRPRSFGQSKYGVWDRLWVGIKDIFGVRWLEQRSGILAADCHPQEVFASSRETRHEEISRIFAVNG